MCALAIAGFGGTVLADSGSGSSGDDEEENRQDRMFLVVVNGPLVQMSEIEVEQRCEQDNEFSDNNTQVCTIALGS